MKRIYYIAVAALAALSVLSCQQKEGPTPESKSDFRIVKTETTLQPAGGSCTISFEATDPVTASTDRDWCEATVSGNTVTVTAGPNFTNESRYTLVTLRSGKSSLTVSILQLGEVLSGLEQITDLTAPVEGRDLAIDILSNVNIILETDQSWIHPSFDGKQILVTVDPNNEPRTRIGEVTYTAGSESGSFNVMQYPELKQETSWVITEGEPSFHYPEFQTSASISAGAEDLYVLYLLPASKVTGDIQDYIFDELAVSTRNEILQKVEENADTEFKDYLLNGTEPIVFENITPGECYLIAIGFGDNSYVSGQYQYKKIVINDIRPDYYKWPGNWKLTGTRFDNTAYSEVVTISILESDVDAEGNLRERYLVINGLESAAVAAWGAPEEINRFYLKYNAETGAITFFGQNSTGTFTRSSLGDGCKLQLMSMYVKAGATTYTSATGFDVMSAKLDGTTGATITVLERSAGLPWLVLRMRCLNAEGSAYTTTNANNAGLKLDKPITMTRAD